MNAFTVSEQFSRKRAFQNGNISPPSPPREVLISDSTAQERESLGLTFDTSAKPGGGGSLFLYPKSRVRNGESKPKGGIRASYPHSL